MGLEQVFRIRCDNCDSGDAASLETESMDATESMELARELGWWNYKTHWYCPKCIDVKEE